MERGIVVATVYASLGLEALVYALNLTNVSAVFTSADLVEKVSVGNIQLRWFVGCCVFAVQSECVACCVPIVHEKNLEPISN